MRRITSLLTSGIIAVSAVCGQMMSATATTYEAPTDIRLTIETKEIAINEIPDNREVSVDIYLDNAPPFEAISFMVKKDSRTEFRKIKHVTKNTDVPNICNCNIDPGWGNTPDITSAMIFSDPGMPISYSGCIARANIVLPDKVDSGDFFSVELVPHNHEDYPEIEIILANDDTAVFGIDSFSEFNSGGILITGAKEAVPGDVDGNGTVDSADASLVLAEYALYMTGKNSSFTPRQRDSADVTGDGSIDSSDASEILRYYADLSTGKAPSWD